MEIRKEVMCHLLQMFDEIEEAIKRVPDGLWQREGAEDLMMVPAFLAHHTIWCMRQRHFLNISEDKLPDNPVTGSYKRDGVPTGEQLLAVLDGIRSYSASFYGQMDNDAYLSKKDTQSEPIGMVMYTIAHTRHHLGQLVEILKEKGIASPKWYPRSPDRTRPQASA